MRPVYRFIVNSDRDSFTIALLLYHRVSGSPARQVAAGKSGTEAAMLKQLQRFLKDESGTAAIEYGLITSGISLAIIPSVKEVGDKLADIFSLLQNAI